MSVAVAARPSVLTEVLNLVGKRIVIVEGPVVKSVIIRFRRMNRLLGRLVSQSSASLAVLAPTRAANRPPYFPLSWRSLVHAVGTSAFIGDFGIATTCVTSLRGFRSCRYDICSPIGSYLAIHGPRFARARSGSKRYHSVCVEKGFGKTAS